MITYILIMVTTAGAYSGGVAIHHIPFNDKQACEIAAQIVRSSSSRGDRPYLWAACVEHK